MGGSGENKIKASLISVELELGMSWAIFSFTMIRKFHHSLVFSSTYKEHDKYNSNPTNVLLEDTTYQGIFLS